MGRAPQGLGRALLVRSFLFNDNIHLAYKTNIHNRNYDVLEPVVLILYPLYLFTISVIHALLWSDEEAMVASAQVSENRLENV